MDRITELLRLAEDSELPDTLTVWDICRLGYPKDHNQQKRFLEFLTRHIAKGTLATAGTVDLLEKNKPGYAVVTGTVVYGSGNPFHACWESSPPPARLPVPLLHQSALWSLLDRTAFLPPPGPYLANWRLATPAPALPLSPTAAPPVDASRRDGGDAGDDRTVEPTEKWVRKTADEQRLPILQEVAADLGIDLSNPGYGAKEKIREQLYSKYPKDFSDDKFETTWKLDKKLRSKG